MRLPLSIEALSHDEYTITDADNKTIIYSGSYTGDGDMEVNMTSEEALTLVELVNIGYLDVLKNMEGDDEHA